MKTWSRRDYLVSRASTAENRFDFSKQVVVLYVGLVVVVLVGGGAIAVAYFCYCVWDRAKLNNFEPFGKYRTYER